VRVGGARARGVAAGEGRFLVEASPHPQMPATWGNAPEGWGRGNAPEGWGRGEGEKGGERPEELVKFQDPPPHLPSDLANKFF